MIKAKIVSSLTKVFIDQKFEEFNELKSISALLGERLSLQLVTEYIKDEGDDVFLQKKWAKPVLSGTLAEHAVLRRVDNVAAEHLYAPELDDGHLERTAPGLYPDVLSPLSYGGKITVKCGCPTSTWIEIEIPKDKCIAGMSELKFELFDDDGNKLTEVKIDINVIGAELPEQTLIVTDWFHCDSLASYYDCEVFSDKHFEIIEKFARMAYKNGMNMILTPTFTPPLDTAVGGERLTTQLVGVTVNDGVYSFDFTLFDRWVDMCDKIGFKYLEIAHLFTQWGAAHAPKVMATVDGEYKKIFGWETDATSPEYVNFIRQFLTELLLHTKKSGNDGRLMFHISDEPDEKHAESYLAAKNSVADILKGYPIMDALSSFDIYKRGIVDMPIPVNDHIEPFIEAGVEGLWTYYCCGQIVDVSNRLLCMSGARNRSIGMQMYKYDIVGFLHWGYNFYNNQFSCDDVMPYTNLSGDHWVPAGDPFCVYPANHGTPLESPRLVNFHEAIQDMRALTLCEKHYPKAEIIAEIEKILGKELKFSVCAYDEDTMLKIRQRINEMIEQAVKI